MLLRHGFFLAPLLATALAQREDGANKITYPNVVNQTFNYMDTVDVTFETDYDTPWLYIFCNQSTTGTLLEIAYYSPSVVEAAKTVLPFELSYDYMPETQCWFNLRSAQRGVNDDNTEQGATSPAFSYNTTEANDLTYGPSSTGTAAATSSATSTSTSSPTSTETSSSGGLSTGAKAGIGAALGGVALVGLVFALVFISIRRRKAAQAEGQGYRLDSDAQEYRLDDTPIVEAVDKQLPPDPPTPQDAVSPEIPDPEPVRVQSRIYELACTPMPVELPEEPQHRELA